MIEANEIRALLEEAKKKGISIKSVANLCDIPASTMYKFSCGQNMYKERQEKVYNTLCFLLDNLR